MGVRWSGVGVAVSPGWALFTVGSLGVLGLLLPGLVLLVGFLAVVIGVHEGAHFWIARTVGIRPTELSWGFGPEVVAVESGGCRYCVRAIFVGGYVKLEGMAPSSVLPADFDEAGTFRSASPGQRGATVAAGPGANLMLAVVAFSIASLSEGVGIGAAVIGGFGATWAVVEGTGEALALLATNFASYVAAVFDTAGETEAPVRFLSPVAQAEVSREAVGLGTAMALRWLGVLSAAVAIVNALPFPPLDGGHAVVAAADAIGTRLRPNSHQTFDVTRLVPLAYLTIGFLLALSASALVLDLREAL